MNRTILKALVYSVGFHLFLGLLFLIFKVVKVSDGTTEVLSPMEFASATGEGKKDRPSPSGKVNPLKSGEEAVPGANGPAVDATVGGSPEGGSFGSGADAEAELESSPQPPYPELAKRRGWAGVVSLVLDISAAGEVRYVSIEHSSGHDVLDEAAVNYYRAAHYRPAMEKGNPVSSKKKVFAEFRL